MRQIFSTNVDAKRTRSSPLAIVWLLVAVSACASGCASSNWISIRKEPLTPLASQLHLFARGGPRPSDRTLLLLRRYDLQSELESDPCGMLVRLREVINREPSADKVYSLSELAYLAGKKTETADPKKALELYAAAVLHAHMYLFDEHYGRSRNPYDPEFRGACDLYNGALESTLRIVNKQGGLLPGKTHTFQSANQTIDVAVVLKGKNWRAEDFENFDFVSDYEVHGLRNQYHTYGLGVPLIAVRKKQENPGALEKFYPPGLSIPVTAFLRMLPRGEGAGDHHTALLELHDPLSSTDIVQAGRRVPMESDLSTPLAYCLNQPQLQTLDQSTTGFLHPDQAEKLKGLYMLEPYQPGKIPVLMVHGLWSSPITWMEMFNDLRSSPEIRDRYQFWFYLYPTGQPFWYSGTELRQDLAEMRNVVDPQRQQWALDQMVLVGHSMGGLVAKMQTVESGNQCWNIVSEKPFEMLKASSEVKQTIANTFFFHPNPSVRRLITIATPHRGSEYANSTTRYISSKLISLPKLLVSESQQVKRDNPGLFRKSDLLLDVKTSIDSLAPGTPIFPVLLEASHPNSVQHNIAGKVAEKGFLGHVAAGGDGVVSLSSAHLDNVESEIIVNADHTNIHRHPLCVLEVRRILLQHLQQLPPRPTHRLDQPPSIARPASPPSAPQGYLRYNPPAYPPIGAAGPPVQQASGAGAGAR